jgi:LysR family hydrogen peroxide-inducible transcriptional activator
LNIRDLKYFVTVAQTGHFTKAAELCFISQPTLSMQIKKLEDFLNIKLFERQQHQIILTEIGALILERAKRILAEVDEIKRIATNAQNPFAGTLKIGAFPTLAPYYFPKIIAPMQKNFPDLKLILVEEKTHILIEKLNSGDIDCTFLATPIINDIFEQTDLFYDEFYLAVSKKHELAKNTSMTYNGLKKYPILLLEEGHCLREQALELCHISQLEEEKNFRATSLETLRQMVIANTGITLIPKLAMNDNENIVYIPFEKNPPSRHIALFWRKSTSRIKLMHKMSEILKDL